MQMFPVSPPDSKHRYENLSHNFSSPVEGFYLRFLQKYEIEHDERYLFKQLN